MTSNQKKILDLQIENIRMKEQLQTAKKRAQEKTERIKKLENTLHYYKKEVENLRKKKLSSKKDLLAEHLTVRNMKEDDGKMKA